MKNNWKLITLIIFCEYTLLALYLDTRNIYLLPTLVYCAMVGLCELKHLKEKENEK